MPYLISPSETFKQSFIENVKEFHAEGRHLEENIEELIKDFGKRVQELLDEKDPSKLKPGRVPATVLWLVEGNEYIGRISIRHELNENLLHWGGHIGYEIRPSRQKQGNGRLILKLGIEKAKELGLKKVLVTCDEDNEASKKIIEGNGGVFDNAVDVEGRPKKNLRYWITIE